MAGSVAALDLALMLAAAAATAGAGTSAPRDPDALFAAQDWPAVEAAYLDLARVRPDDALAHFRVALARLRLGRPADALDEFRRAEDLGWPVPQTAFRLACAYARIGRTDLALEQLVRATRAGFSGVQLLNDEADLEPLRGQATFAEVLRSADRNLRPCLFDSAYSEFDFWLGQWDVRPAGAALSAPPASSSITKVLDGCVVLESWAGQTHGQSFNVFDKTERKWRQTWVDTTGGLHEYWGARDGESMAFTGLVAEAPGRPRVPTRMTFTRLGPDRVRQLSETSTDGGKTWTVSNDLIYTRKVASPS